MPHLTPLSDLLILQTCAVALGVIFALLALMRLIRGTIAHLAAPSSAPLPGTLTRALTEEDREFLPAALEIIETPPAPLRVAALWLICLTFGSALLWSYLGRIDIHAVAQGRIQPSGRSKVIQPLEPGKIVAIKVQNGSRVEAGDVLLELDPTETGADREQLSRDLESSRAEAARRKVAIAIARSGELEPRPVEYPAIVSDAVREREDDALIADINQITGTVASLRAQYAEHQATLEKLKSSIAARERLIKLAKERVGMREELNANGSLSRAMVIEVLSQYETLMTTQAEQQGQIAETDSQMLTLKAKMEESLTQFVADQKNKFLDAERKADRTAQDLVKAKVKNERTTLRSPIAGSVQQLAVTTVGQVAGSGQSLMVIVPQDSAIEIEAMVENQDIGFVEEGQPAVVKIEAFPFTRFGTLNGTVQRVSRDAVDQREAQAMSDPMGAAKQNGASAQGSQSKTQGLVFPATVRLERASISIDGKAIPLTPGMAVTVEILTGQRRAIDYLLSPLRELASTTARER